MDIKGQKTILLVEDEAIIAMNDSIKLKEYGYNIIHVLNGQKAVEAVNDNKNEIDLILMDINLGGGIDGTEAAKIILEEHDIPLLFLSSYTDREIVDRTENVLPMDMLLRTELLYLMLPLRWLSDFMKHTWN
jgi:CheY-like chemotaxis protein